VRYRLLDAIALLATALALGSLFLPSGDEPPPLTWQSYSPVSLRSATRAGKPAVVAVAAAWCAPCVEMERTTFRDPAVVALTRGFLLFRVDVTASTSGASTGLSQPRVAAVPTIILFDRRGREVSRLVGYISPTTFARALEEVVAIGTGRARPHEIV